MRPRRTSRGPIFETALAWGKVPVHCRSTPGFIVNRVARPFYGEALRLLQEQAATPATLDAVMREIGGFKMGPCELMDLIGHDVNFAVTRSVYDGFFDDPRYKPSLMQKDLVDAGWLGRKSGRGFFDYREGAAPPAAGGGRRRRPGAWSVRIEGDLGPAQALVDLLRARQDETAVERAAGDGPAARRRPRARAQRWPHRDRTVGRARRAGGAVRPGARLRHLLAHRSRRAGAGQRRRTCARRIGLFVALGKKVSRCWPTCPGWR